MKLTAFDVAIVEDDSHLSKWIVEHGRLDVQADFLKLFKHHIPEGGTVVDGGACLGDHTLTYSQFVGDKGHVHAFEPNPVAFECLAYNMKERANVTCHNVGLGDEFCMARVLHRPEQEKNLGANQLRPAIDGKIQVHRLDEIAGTDEYIKGFNRLDFMKIDAEGFEPLILDGAKETIKRCRPVMLIEVNKGVLVNQGFTEKDIYERLFKLGYTYRPCEPHLSLDLDMVDVICIPL